MLVDLVGGWAGAEGGKGVGFGVQDGFGCLCAGELCVVYAYDEAEEEGVEGEGEGDLSGDFDQAPFNLTGVYCKEAHATLLILS